MTQIEKIAELVEAQASLIQIKEVGRMVGEGGGRQTILQDGGEVAQMWQVLLRAGLTLWHVPCTKKREKEF